MMRRYLALLLATLALFVWTGAAFAQVPTAGTVNARANVRSGPGTTNAVVGSLTPGTSVTISSCNTDCSWYQIGPDRWIAAFLVTTTRAAPQPTASAPSAPAAAPTPTNPTAAPATEQGYIDFLNRSADAYNNATDRLENQFDAVIQNAENLNDGWFVDTTAIISGIRSMHGEIRAQVVPARFAAVHAELVTAMTHYDQAMVLILQAFGSLDGSKLQAAIPELIAGNAAVDRFNAGLEALGYVRIPESEDSTPNQSASPSATPSASPAASNCTQATRSSNLRAGPGTNYGVAGSAQPGQCLTITGRTAAGDWYRLSSGQWIAAFLVRNAPALDSIPVIEAVQANL